MNVLTVLRGSEPISNPKPDLVLEAGDHLISLGTVQQFEQLALLAENTAVS